VTESLPQTKAVQLYLTKSGELLFYTDGSFVYTKTININGYGLRDGIQYTIGYHSAQYRNPYVYYIFTVDEPNELNADEYL
jgi:hypothetical protein